MHRVAYEQKCLSLCSGCGEAKIKVLADLVSSEDLLSGSAVLPPCPRPPAVSPDMREGAKELPGHLLYKSTNPIQGEQTNHLPKAPPPSTLYWGLGFNIQILEGHMVYENHSQESYVIKA